MSKDHSATQLAEALRRAVPSRNAIEEWVATRLFAALSPAKGGAPGKTAQDADGRFVLMHSGPVDLIALARAAVRSVRDAEAAAQRWRDRPDREATAPGARQ
jgi:hypothetical protein